MSFFTRYSRMKKRVGNLEASLQTANAAIASLQETIASQHAAIEAHHAAMVTLPQFATLQRQFTEMGEALTVARAAADADIKTLHRENGLIARILTGGSAARPPGATEAIAKLPNPSVSVVLPTFNRARFIGDAITSVQRQSFANWELVIVDDGSTDDTSAVVAPFLADRRITCVRQDNGGDAAARNRGIAETGAPLVAYIDSDNVWYPDFLACAVDCFAAKPEVDFAYGALVSDHHGLGDVRILWKPFDRDALLTANFMDTNVIVHRRTLVARYGRWDSDVKRMSDWDLALRYTSEKPAHQLPVLAAQYRVCDERRVSDVELFGPSQVKLAKKWFPPIRPTRRPRVLYAVWHYPQLSETYIEAEIQCMKNWGVQIEVWRTSAGVSPYPTNVPMHDGTLEEAIQASRPDIIHVHWISFAFGNSAIFADCNIPVTLRLHGFDVTAEGLSALATHHWVKAVYAFPHQIRTCPFADARIKPLHVAFDTTLFSPQRGKDRKLVIRTAAALPSKDLTIFFEAARRLPEFRFVLAAVTCHHREAYVTELHAIRDAMGSPAEIRMEVPREAIAELVGKAGIYLHTLHPPGMEHATPIGEPISIAEAMATGCHCFVRELPEFQDYVGKSGDTYRDIDELVGKIRATSDWNEQKWEGAQAKSIEQAYSRNADLFVFRPLFNDWMAMSEMPSSQA